MNELITCPHCGKQQSHHSMWCEKCGQSLSRARTYGFSSQEEFSAQNFYSNSRSEWNSPNGYGNTRENGRGTGALTPSLESSISESNTRSCRYCGKQIHRNASVCPHCGFEEKQYGERSYGDFQKTSFQENFNNLPQKTSSFNSHNFRISSGGRCCNKWISLLLCFFTGTFGIHKFYEGKNVMGIIYLLSFGLFGIGPIVDFFIILFKPTTYDVD